MTERLGYVVAGINQASGVAETVTPDIHFTRENAEVAAEMDRQDAARDGRRDRYVVCEVVPVLETAASIPNRQET